MARLSILTILATLQGCAYCENPVNWTVGASKSTMRWELSLAQYQFIGNLEEWCDAALGEGWEGGWHEIFTEANGEFQFFPIYNWHIFFKLRTWYSGAIALTTEPKLSAPRTQWTIASLEGSPKKHHYVEAEQQNKVLWDQCTLIRIYYTEEDVIFKHREEQYWGTKAIMERHKWRSFSMMIKNHHNLLNVWRDNGSFEGAMGYDIKPEIPFTFIGFGSTADDDASWKIKDMYTVESFFAEADLQVACDYYIKIMSYCSYPGIENYDVDQMFWKRCWPNMVYVPDKGQRGRLFSNGLIISTLVVLFYY